MSSARFRAASRSAALLLVLTGLLAPAVAQAAAPDPGGDENAQISLPVPGKEFGFSGLFNPAAVSTTGLSSPLAASLIHQAGGNAARMPMPWWGLEPNQDQWNESLWTSYAATYADMVAQGITPHFILMDAPPWARDPGTPQSCLSHGTCHYPPAVAMLDQWKQFVAEVAWRFPKAAIEVWNEPNFKGNWMTGVDPARYAQLLAAAYDAAKAVDPSIPVIMGGLGASVKTNSLTIPQFLDGAYAASPSLKGHTDALNFHVYPGRFLGAGSTFAQVFQNVRSERAAYGDQSTPLLVSETGATTSGSGALSEADQADLVLRTVRKTLTMPDVSGALLYTLTDQPQYAASDPEYGFGVMHSATDVPLTPKPAYCVLTRLGAGLYSGCPRLATIDSGPSGLVNQTSATLSFSASEPGATFECSLDDGGFSPCLSPTTYDGLADGQHTFAVRGVDLLGVLDPDSATRTFTVDATPPDTTIDSGPAGLIASASPGFTFSASEAGSSFECSLDGGAYASCNSPDQLSGLGDGSRTFRVRAIDAAGNADPTPAERSFSVDTRPPAVSVDSGPQGPTRQTTPTFGFSADEPATFNCRIDSAPFGPCTTTGTYQVSNQLPEGDHAFEVRATDQAGNTSTARRTFTVDLTPPPAPKVTIVGARNGTVGSSTVKLSISDSEAGVSYRCSIDGAPATGCGSSPVFTGVKKGKHTISVWAVDAAGNVSSATTVTFKVL